MRLNCDLGESVGDGAMGADEAVMPHIDQANIACGFHAGDPLAIRHTLALAAKYGVAVGAHPAYPDLAGFGRRSMQLSCEQISANLHYQIAALDGMAQCTGLSLSYVKPHGALYHDMMARDEVRSTIFQAIASYHRPLELVIQATAQADAHRAEAQACGIQLLFEVFADRCYGDDGALLDRSQPGAVLNREHMIKQVSQLLRDNTVTSVSGSILPLHADTLCVHGDNPEGVRSIEAVRALLDNG